MSDLDRVSRPSTFARSRGVDRLLKNRVEFLKIGVLGAAILSNAACAATIAPTRPLRPLAPFNAAVRSFLDRVAA